MFDSQLGQALFEIFPGEVSSSIAYQDSWCTETRKIMLLIMAMDSSVEALRHGIASTHLDTQ
jgi:hypothetical protein